MTKVCQISFHKLSQWAITHLKIYLSWNFILLGVFNFNHASSQSQPFSGSISAKTIDAFWQWWSHQSDPVFKQSWFSQKTQDWFPSLSLGIRKKRFKDFERTQKRNELIMLPIPKPKFFERKVRAGQSEEDYFDEISERQTHILRDAIDRVSC